MQLRNLDESHSSGADTHPEKGVYASEWYYFIQLNHREHREHREKLSTGLNLHYRVYVLGAISFIGADCLPRGVQAFFSKRLSSSLPDINAKSSIPKIFCLCLGPWERIKPLVVCGLSTGHQMNKLGML